LSAHTLRYLTERPELVRVVAQACLDRDESLLSAVSPHPERLCEIVDAVKSLMDTMSLPVTVDAKVLNAYAISSILGWILFKPLLEAGFDLPDDADAQLTQSLELLDMLMKSTG
jgi:hypothetical protein